MKAGVGAVKISRRWLYGLAAFVVASGLYLFKLGSLTHGLSSSEVLVATTPFGWHGLYHHPMFLPLNIVRSAIFWLRPTHGQTLTRLADVPFGLVSIAAFYGVIRWWYGLRVAWMSTALFACSAWCLHISRFAGNEVMYLCAGPLLLWSTVAVRKHFASGRLYLLCGLLWLALLYVPGMIWLVALTLYVQRRYIAAGWRQLATSLRLLVSFLSVVFLAFLGWDLHRPGEWRLWLGLPNHFANVTHLFKQFAGVFVHLFIHGPLLPETWLGKAPVLDIFCLSMSVIGIYFLARHVRAFRTRLLLAYFLIGAILIGLGGPVALSLLVPFVFVLIATGLAYLNHEWFRTFPINPLARAVGLGLLCVAIALSCIYNLRAYFVAWPHNANTKAVFRYHR